MPSETTAADANQPSEFGAAWLDAAAAADRLARGASNMVSNFRQARIPTNTEARYVQDTLTELVDALAALNRLESNRHA